MPRRALAAVAGMLLLASPAAAAERPCKDELGMPLRCSTVAVPIDRSGAVQGSVKLAVRRLPARSASKTGVMLFPGGPGASTNDLALTAVAELQAALRTRHLVLFDQRGTGRSGYLDCDILEYRYSTGFTQRSYEKSVERCATKLGPRRAFYSTPDTSADIEAVRQALGLERLVLVGVSYGTRNALDYAARHPERVERMVLDSVVPLEGPSPYGLESIAAVPRVLASLCRGGGCRGITDDPVGDLATLVDRIRERGAVRPRRAVEFFGCRFRPALTRSALLGSLVLGDMETGDRSSIPAVVKAAAGGDGTPYAFVSVFERADDLGRCVAESIGFTPGLRQGGLQDDGDRSFSLAANAATYCEDGPMPWPRGTPPADRNEAAERGLAELPDSAFEPFDRATALAYAKGNGCRFWPDSGRELPPPGALPDVPVLVLAGEEDLRTPLEAAARAAASFRRSKLVAVPDYGHSTLDQPCAQRALRRFFADRPVGDCHRPAKVLPRPVTVRELRCISRFLNDLAQLFGGRVPAGDGRCARVLDRYFRDLASDLADRRS